MIPVSFVGKLGKNCEVKTVGQNNTPVIQMSIAVTVRNGQNKDTIWLNCSYFGKVAQSQLIDYLHKGREVQVSGMLTSTNVGNDGKAYLNVNVNGLTLTNGTKQEASQAQPQQQQGGYGQNNQQNNQQQATRPPQGNNQHDLDDDLPF